MITSTLLAIFHAKAQGLNKITTQINRSDYTYLQQHLPQDIYAIYIHLDQTHGIKSSPDTLTLTIEWPKA